MKSLCIAIVAIALIGCRTSGHIAITIRDSEYVTITQTTDAEQRAGKEVMRGAEGSLKVTP